MINVDPKVLEKLFKDLEEYSEIAREKWEKEFLSKEALKEKLSSMTEEECKIAYPQLYSHLEFLKNRKSLWQRLKNLWQKIKNYFKNVIS